MSNGNQVTPADQFIIGAFIAVGIGIFALLVQVLNLTEFTAIVTGYAAAGIAYGVYLLESSNAIHSWWKYVAIFIITVVAYALTQLAQMYHLITGASSTVQPAIIAAFVMSVADFGLNDLQTYKQFIPDNVVNTITAVIGGIIVTAEAVKNAAPGTIINISTLLAVVVPVLMVYIFQLVPWPPLTTTTTGKTAKTA
jgi:hypothetical protein